MSEFHELPLQIKLTEPARNRIGQMLAGAAEGTSLRISVHGGGCGGMEYGFDLDDQYCEYDLFYEEDGVKIVIDAISRTYVLGSEIDFQDNLMGSRFIINNPNAKTTCGCGGSFSF